MTIKFAALLVELAALGYVALNVVGQMWPLLEISVGYALESEMAEVVATTETSNLQPLTEDATSAVPIRAASTLPVRASNTV